MSKYQVLHTLYKYSLFIWRSVFLHQWPHFRVDNDTSWGSRRRKYMFSYFLSCSFCCKDFSL